MIEEDVTLARWHEARSAAFRPRSGKNGPDSMWWSSPKTHLIEENVTAASLDAAVVVVGSQENPLRFHELRLSRAEHLACRLQIADVESGHVWNQGDDQRQETQERFEDARH